MSGWTEWIAPAGTGLGLGTGVYTITQTMSLLEAKRRGSGVAAVDARRMTAACYLFCLSAYLTVVIGVVLERVGQLSPDGRPLSSGAAIAFHLAGEAVDFAGELLLVAVLLSIVIVPQLMNYFVAGLFGVAGGTRFGAWCLRFVFWTVVKGFAVAGGVSVAWGALALALHWPKVYDGTPINAIGTGLTRVAAAVFAAALAGPLEDESLAMLKSKIAPLVGPLRRVHRWFRRFSDPRAKHSEMHT